MRILVPVDGSENSMHAVEFIASRTTLLGSNPEIEVLNVQLPLPARACRLVGQDSLTRYYEDEAAKVFEPVRAELNKVGFQAGEAFLVGVHIAPYENAGYAYPDAVIEEGLRRLRDSARAAG